MQKKNSDDIVKGSANKELPKRANKAYNIKRKGAHLHRLLRMPNKKLERLLQKASDIRLRYCINYKVIIYKRRFEEYVQEDDGGSTTSNNQADDVPKIPSSARSIAQLMQDSITQQPPLFLMP
ncbi:unnamed protein product [Acanthoscelides obtectus]|uniref:Uncharacterized protein n=1 Tax=Acanthoscelides obtectus TaxID=200917 RepID=A0A9P0K243_ACAOB|nr:unnamed protein product [Acanthoscelides obtectus]CAK1660352.1 hypothetical protein AOBTE_LOCUS22010 [Acanthoscelides obtectus]